jgi:hypothetical protein
MVLELFAEIRARTGIIDKDDLLVSEKRIERLDAHRR